nr:hypothetical protein BaRGS_007401 [Batillaria attramentaria]
MTIVVLRRMSAKQSAVSMSVYFIALAVSDLFILYASLTKYWILHTFGVDSCGHTALNFCVHEGKQNFIVAAIFAIWTTSLSHVLYSFEIFVDNNSTAMVCSLKGAADGENLQTASCALAGTQVQVPAVVDEDAEYIEYNIYTVLDLSFASLLPFSILFVCNVILVWKVAQSVQKARKMEMSVRTARRMGMVSSAHVTSRQRKATSLTVTLIVTSTAFLLLTLPIAVFFILQKNASLDAYDADGDYLAKMELAYTICNLLWIEKVSIRANNDNGLQIK